MPLIHGKSQKAFEKNIKTEMHHGKPQAQSLAIAYAVKRKAQHKKAHGGYMEAEKTESHGDLMEHEAKEGAAHEKAEHMAHGGYAKGGEVEHHKNIGSRTKAAKREREKEHIKGVHKSQNIYRPGSSEAGYNARALKEGPVFKKQATQEHEKVLGEMKAMPKPKLLAEGGYIGSYQSSEQPHYDADFADMDHDKEEMASGYMSHEGAAAKHNAAAMHEDERKLGQHGMMEEGPEDGYAHGGFIGSHQGPEHEMDMVGRIMAKRMKHYSMGGVVANDTDIDYAKKEPAEYDYLVKEGGDSFHYTGANSGDEKSTAGELSRKEQMLRKIMASRAKKDKMPYYP